MHKMRFKRPVKVKSFNSLIALNTRAIASYKTLVIALVPGGTRCYYFASNTLARAIALYNTLLYTGYVELLEHVSQRQKSRWHDFFGHSDKLFH